MCTYAWIRIYIRGPIQFRHPRGFQPSGSCSTFGEKNVLFYHARRYTRSLKLKSPLGTRITPGLCGPRPLVPALFHRSPVWSVESEENEESEYKRRQKDGRQRERERGREGQVRDIGINSHADI